MGTYALRDHTADVAVEATADSLGGVFAAVADGMTAAMTGGTVPADGERFSLKEVAEDLEAALYDYLDRLIYERDVRGVLPVDHQASVEETADGWVVTASARGVPFDAVDARDLKAVTYSDMSVGETANGWHAYVVFDV